MVVYGEGNAICADARSSFARHPGSRRRLLPAISSRHARFAAKPLSTNLVDEDTAIRSAQRLRHQQGGAGILCRQLGSHHGRVGGRDALSQRLRTRHAQKYALCRCRGDFPVRACGKASRTDGFRGWRAAARLYSCARYRGRYDHGLRASTRAGVRAFNVGSGTPRTVGQMAEALAQALDGPAPMVTGKYRLGDVRHITADSSRLVTDLGFRPTEGFTEGMRELSGAV